LKQPRSNLSYDRILKEKKMNFGTFKNIYGHTGTKGVKTVRVGDSTLQVDTKNYTYSVVPPAENESRKRLLGQVHISQQSVDKERGSSVGTMPQIVQPQQDSKRSIIEVGS
jgi:hypothetical protein